MPLYTVEYTNGVDAPALEAVPIEAPTLNDAVAGAKASFVRVRDKHPDNSVTGFRLRDAASVIVRQWRSEEGF